MAHECPLVMKQLAIDEYSKSNSNFLRPLASRRDLCVYIIWTRMKSNCFSISLVVVFI